MSSINRRTPGNSDNPRLVRWWSILLLDISDIAILKDKKLQSLVGLADQTRNNSGEEWLFIIDLR